MIFNERFFRTANPAPTIQMRGSQHATVAFRAGQVIFIERTLSSGHRKRNTWPFVPTGLLSCCHRLLQKRCLLDVDSTTVTDRIVIFRQQILFGVSFKLRLSQRDRRDWIHEFGGWHKFCCII